MTPSPTLAELALLHMVELEKVGGIIAAHGGDADLVAAMLDRARRDIIGIVLDANGKEA